MRRWARRSGILDGIGYFGAMLAGVGLAKVLVSYGWNVAFSAMSLVAIIAFALCFVLWNVKPKGL